MSKKTKLLWIKAAGLVLSAAVLMGMPIVPIAAEDAVNPQQYQYAETNTIEQTLPPPSEDMELVAVSGETALFFDPLLTRFAVTTPSGVWYSFLSEEEFEADETAAGEWRRAMQSLLTVTTCDENGDNVKEYASYRESVANGMYTVQYLSRDGVQVGLRIDFTFDEFTATIPMQILLEDGALTVAVLTDQIKEEDPTYVITDIAILPYFGSAGKEEKGYLLLPEGCGGVANFNNGAVSAGRFETRIYGEDRTFVPDYQGAQLETTRLPVWGIHKENRGMLAIIEDGDAYASLIAEVSGINTDQNFVHAQFNLRQKDAFPIKDLGGTAHDFTVIDREKHEFGNLTVRYQFLNGAKSDYSAMAKSYQDYLVAEKGLTKQKNTADMMLEFYGVVKKSKSVAGIPMKVKQKLTDFSQAEQILKELAQEGVTDVGIRYRYATDAQVNKKPQNKLKLSGKLGSRSDYEKLTQLTGKENCYISVNNTESKSGIFNFDAKFVQNIMNLSVYQYEYDLILGYKQEKGARHRLLTMESAAEKYERLLDQQNGTEQPLCLDDIGNELYSGFGNERFTREDQKDVWLELLAKAKEQKQRLMLEGGNAYALPYASMIANAPVKTNGLTMIDYDVPFYQMVLGDYVASAAYSINQTSNPQKQFLKCLETGSLPQFSLIAEEPSVLQQTELQQLFGTDYSKWKADIVSMYTDFHKLREAVGKTAPISHRMVQEDVFETTYGNGVKVLVNYNQESVTAAGNQIDGMSYRISGKEGNEIE